MKRHRLFRITVSDETRLEDRASWVLSPLRLTAFALSLAFLFIAIGMAIMAFTPTRHLLPGYLRKEQRAATELAFLRIDSLNRQLDLNRRYIENFLEVIDSSRTPQPVDSMVSVGNSLNPDSLMGPSEAEERFVATVARRDRFNMAVLAPLDAEGMIFTFPATTGYYSGFSPDGTTARIQIARESSILSVADGTVVGVSRSTRERGYVVWIQHDNGFLSRYSRLGTPMVDRETRVAGGEAIAAPANNTATNGYIFEIQLWHNGEPLSPQKYLPQAN